MYMTLFQVVKHSVSTRQAAEYYHFPINRSGLITCPFHNDHTPSMKVDTRFHCFGCGADGDVIDFVARLYQLDAMSAAEKLAADFHIPHEKAKRKARAAPTQNEKQLYCKLEARCFRVLSDYLHLLRQWEEEYAPKLEDETWHPLFVKALQKKDHIEYLLDVLLSEPLAERAALIREYGREVMKMLKNNNQQVIKRMAKTSFFRNKGKNLVLVCAVFLAVFMLFRSEEHTSELQSH